MKHPKQLDMLDQPKPADRAKEPPQVYVLTLRALPDDIAADYRLKRALKCLLRRFGFRCTTITSTEPPQTTDIQ